MTTLNDTRPLAPGDVLCNEDDGEVYLFKRFDTMGRIIAWDDRHCIVALHPLPPNLHRYDQGPLVADLLPKDATTSEHGTEDRT